MQLENKRIIVTGGTRGIGAGTVRAYVREGAKVVFCGTNDERGKATEAEANGQDGVTIGHATYIRCDIRSKESVDDFFAKAVEILGGLDVLAHVAGVEHNNTAENYTKEEMDFLFSVNVYGLVYANQAAYKVFKDTGVEGAIINYASDTGMAGMRNGAIYAASKGAVLAWTRTIAMEWGIESNVRCNCACPAIKTPMYEAWLASADPMVVEAHKAALREQFPIDGSLGDVDRDMAPVMVFLASDASRYINGQTISVNGGSVMVR